MTMRSLITALWPSSRKTWLSAVVIALIVFVHLIVIQWTLDSLEFIQLLDADNDTETVTVSLSTAQRATSKPATPVATKPTPPTPAAEAAAPNTLEPPTISPPSAAAIANDAEVNRTHVPAAEVQTPVESNLASAVVNDSAANTVTDKKTEPEAATIANGNITLFEKISLPPSAELIYTARAMQGTRSLSGSGSIQWQQNGQTYTVKGEANALFLSLLSYQSSGQLGKAGILPDLYHEKRIGKSATQTHFVRERKTISFSASTAVHEIQGSEQDRGSIIWQLVGVARGDPTKLEPGLTFETIIAGTKAADRWRVQISGIEKLTLADGNFSAWHWVLVPVENRFDYQIDLWLAPEKEWYPVKIMYGNRTGANLTMTLEKFHPK
jgi:hypothetical protein